MPEAKQIDQATSVNSNKSGGWTRYLVLLAFMAIPLVVGWLGAMATASSISDWYPSLTKPAFNPPNWVFGPVWTLLYLMMGFAGWRVWQAPAHLSDKQSALWFFAIQLVLNLAWSFAFFWLRSPLAGLAVIVMLLAAIGLTAFRFWRIDRLAGWLFVPYLAWVGFATLLNLAIVMLN